MMQKPGRHSLFVAMLVTVPCPSVFLLCNGLLPELHAGWFRAAEACGDFHWEGRLGQHRL